MAYNNSIHPVRRRYRPPVRKRHPRLPCRFSSTSLVLLFVTPAFGLAQGNYYNTDAGRPGSVEDAQVLSLYSLDLYLAPVSLERVAGSLGLVAKPGVAYGLLPRIQVQFTVPVLSDMREGRRRIGGAGLDVSMLSSLWDESGSLPAIGARVGVLLPAGGFGPANPLASVKAIATRTLPWGRLHLNGQYSFGNAVVVPALREAPPNGLSRWWAGATLDRAFPLRSMLLSASVLHEQPLEKDGAGWWRGAGGLRYQLSPSVVLDGAVGLRLGARDRAWNLALGFSRVSAVRALLPGLGAWRRR